VVVEKWLHDAISPTSGETLLGVFEKGDGHYDESSIDHVRQELSYVIGVLKDFEQEEVKNTDKPHSGDEVFG
jgi:hypothetical protein